MKAAPHVLIVEDDECIRTTLKLLLEFEGCHVVTATNGQEGLAALPATQPSLIFLDLMMPIMDGWEFAEALKDTPYADTALVVTTACPDRVGRIRHEGILEKPITLRAVRGLIERCR